MIVKGVSGKSGFFLIELPIELPIVLPIVLPIELPIIAYGAVPVLALPTFAVLQPSGQLEGCPELLEGLGQAHVLGFKAH